jgi:hypothetical protein
MADSRVRANESIDLDQHRHRGIDNHRVRYRRQRVDIRDPGLVQGMQQASASDWRWVTTCFQKSLAGTHVSIPRRLSVQA